MSLNVQDASSAYTPITPYAPSQQKADAQKLAAQYHNRVGDGTAEASAKAVADTIHVDAAAQGADLSLAHATSAVNTVIARAQADTGVGSGATPFLQTPYGVASQQADVHAIAGAYHRLTGSGQGEAAVSALASATKQVAGNAGLNLTLAGVTTSVEQAIAQTQSAAGGPTPLNVIG